MVAERASNTPGHLYTRTCEVVRMPKRECITTLVGAKFGRWTVVGITTHKRGYRCLWCVCECGTERVVPRHRWGTRKCRSCGCLHYEEWAERRRQSARHGAHKGYKPTRTYKTWQAMRQRCRNPKNKSYPNYGGRGIKVCERWAERYENFLADMGERPVGKTLDRIDTNGDYTPENCRWATPKEQQRNTRITRYIEHDGLRLSVTEWSERTGLHAMTIRCRIKNGWPVGEALRTPKIAPRDSLIRTQRKRASVTA